MLYSIYLSTQTNPVPQHTLPSLSPTIWHTHRTDGQVGRRRQAPVANSPSPVAVLPLTGGNDDISSLGIRSLCEIASAPQPHLTCLFPLRFLRAVVASLFNGLIQSANDVLPPGERRLCGNDSLEPSFGPESAPLPLLFRRRTCNSRLVED